MPAYVIQLRGDELLMREIAHQPPTRHIAAIAGTAAIETDLSLPGMRLSPHRRWRQGHGHAACLAAPARHNEECA